MMKNAPTLSRFCRCDGLGIDVSKATLEIVGIENDQVWKAGLNNTEIAMGKHGKTLHQSGFGATRGVYRQDYL